MIVRDQYGNAEYLTLNENNKVQGELRERLAPPVSSTSKSLFQGRTNIDEYDFDKFYSADYDKECHDVMDKLAEQYGVTFHHDEPKAGPGQFCISYRRTDEHIVDAVADDVMTCASENGVDYELSDSEYEDYVDRQVCEIMIPGAESCGNFPCRYSDPMDFDTFSRMYNDMRSLGGDDFSVSFSYADPKGKERRFSQASLSELRLSVFSSWGVDDPGARDIIDDVFAKYKDDPENSAACAGVMNELDIIESERKGKKQALADFNKAVSSLGHGDSGLESDLDRVDMP